MLAVTWRGRRLLWEALLLGTLLGLHRMRLTGTTCDWPSDTADSSIPVRLLIADRLPSVFSLFCTATACGFPTAMGLDCS